MNFGAVLDRLPFLPNKEIPVIEPSRNTIQVAGAIGQYISEYGLFTRIKMWNLVQDVGMGIGAVKDAVLGVPIDGNGINCFMFKGRHLRAKLGSPLSYCHDCVLKNDCPIQEIINQRMTVLIRNGFSGDVDENLKEYFKIKGIDIPSLEYDLNKVGVKHVREADKMGEELGRKFITAFPVQDNNTVSRIMRTLSNPTNDLYYMLSSTEGKTPSLFVLLYK